MTGLGPGLAQSGLAGSLLVMTARRRPAAQAPQPRRAAVL